MSSRLRVAIIGILILGAIVFFALRPKNTPEAEVTEEETPQEALAAPVVSETPAPAEDSAPIPAIDNDTIIKIRQEKFVAALKMLNTCLQLASDPTEPLEPSFDNLNNLLRSTTGEPVVRNEDWSSTLLELPNGERRRIRVEMDYAGEEFVRKLKYEILRDNAEPELIPIANEQSENPSETFIASLESDGKITTKEKRSRVYYPNGAEIMYSEKNGLLTTLEISMVEGRKFKCSQMDTAESSCTCQ